MNSLKRGGFVSQTSATRTSKAIALYLDASFSKYNTTNDMSDVLRTLKELFPSLTQHAIESTFNNCQGNFDSAVDQLLEMASAERRQDPNQNLNHVGASHIIDLSDPVHSNATLHQNEPDLISLDSSSSPQSANQLDLPNSPYEEKRQLQTAILDDCLQAILTIVPDVDPAYIEKLWQDNKVLHPNISEFILNTILEAKGLYPKSAHITSTGRKRKIQEVDAKPDGVDYNDPNRQLGTPGIYYHNACRKILSADFRQVPVTHINQVFTRGKFFLYPAYQKLANSEEDYDPLKPTLYRRLMKPRKEIQVEELEQEYRRLPPDTKRNLLEELDAVRTERRETMLKLKREQDAILQRQLQEEEAKRTGDMFECQCCFSEELWDQATHCLEGHLFCKECCQRNAESQVGSGKYKLMCMDASGCQAIFPRSEMERILSQKTLEALHTNEQADVLYQAEIDGLIHCPFCPFAAICPPIEVDKEFRCENPDCMEISCRHCKEKSHIPLSCEEFSKENRQSLRKTVEEAMTEALMRKCKKCGLGYVKESGCNKIQCSRCKTMSCYVCSEIVRDYSHFNDSGRGGKNGNCPLFENTDERHESEIREAEKIAIAKIQAEIPGIDEDEMKVKLSQAVEQAEKQKISRAGPARMAPGQLLPIRHRMHVQPQPPAYQMHGPGAPFVMNPERGHGLQLADQIAHQHGMQLPGMQYFGPAGPAVQNYYPVPAANPEPPQQQLHARVRQQIIRQQGANVAQNDVEMRDAQHDRAQVLMLEHMAALQRTQQFRGIPNNNFVNMLPVPPRMHYQQQPHQQQQPQVLQQVNTNLAPTMPGNVRVNVAQHAHVNPGVGPAGRGMRAPLNVPARNPQRHPNHQAQDIIRDELLSQRQRTIARANAAAAVNPVHNNPPLAPRPGIRRAPKAPR